MNKTTHVIVYEKTEEEGGGISIVIPSINSSLSLQEIARKDVPAGRNYVFVPRTDFPADREFRNAWTVDMSTPDGQGIGNDAWWAEQETE